MQTSFSPQALTDPGLRGAEEAIRRCVHCGFCTATCPTYALLGDELDSPRGRIGLIQDMLEADAAPTRQVVRHLDRCLSCLSCMTTCPSGVDYRRLIDLGRAHIERKGVRRPGDRLVRWALANLLPYRRRFHWALRLGRWARPLRPLLTWFPGAERLVAALNLAAAAQPSAAPVTPAARPRESSVRRVVLAQGCVETVLRPQIQAATEALLERLGVGVVRLAGEGCCGALAHHMGREDEAKAAARRLVDLWAPALDAGCEAIVVTASGCGASARDFGHLLADDPAYAARAAQVAARTMDITAFLATLDLPPPPPGARTVVAYHDACSLQHGQRLKEPPRRLLRAAGFDLREPVEPHLCCGSAGAYSILEPAIAGALGDRKAAALAVLGADVICAGNIGCLHQIGARSKTPVVHTVELLNWAWGGVRPAALPPLLESPGS